MVKIQGSTVIARRIEDVFDFVADERNEPIYNPQMTKVKKLTPGPVEKGTRWAATVETRGRPNVMEIEVTEFVRPFRIGSHTTLTTAEIDGQVTFNSQPNGTTMTWSWDLQPKGMLRLMGPLVAYIGRRQEAKIWEGLKRHLEAPAEVSGG